MSYQQVVLAWELAKGDHMFVIPGANEVRRILGFPENFSFPVSENHAYEQLGNSVAVPVLKLIAEQIVSTGVFDEDRSDPETAA